jgi:dTDP-4-dehydrorhamnose 3,5-epimerase
MTIHPTEVEGAYWIEVQKHVDERGFFARSFCREEFEKNGLDPQVEQCNISGNLKRGTFRGLHAQRKPHQETKLVRCEKGSLYDLVLDLRPDSPSYMKHFGIELSEENRRLLYIPKGCYHGFITLADDTVVFYQLSHAYAPDHAHGVRWNDPAFGIELPIEVAIINERDANYPDYQPVEKS